MISLSKLVTTILLAFSGISAAVVDTTIIADGSPGPYCIGSQSVDTGSIVVSMGDSERPFPWTFIDSRNALLFASSIDSGINVRVHYKTMYYGLTKTYSLYNKRYLKPEDTASLGVDAFTKGSLLSIEQEELAISGYKSVGVQVGSFGQINLEQGLDVRIGGEIRAGTDLSAHLSDKGSSLDGATREISDFDMIYIGLTNMHYGVTVGDQYVQWPIKGLLTGQKKVKGLSVQYMPYNFRVSGFGALAGGNYTTQTIHGKDGIQGPYYLTGKGEQEIISPIGGTVKVRLNGKELEEGPDNDYIVDYDLGAITFTPKTPVNDEDLIRMDYEYKLFNYQRVLVGANAGYARPDSSVSVQAVVWSEGDNPDHPTDLQLTDAEQDSLRTAGDRPVFASTARAVHPNDVPTQNKLYPLYKMGVDAQSGDSCFVYTPYKPESPDSLKGYYYVWFTKVNGGDYTIDPSSVHREVVYKWAGKGKGSFLPRAPLPSPQRTVSGEVSTSIALPLLHAKIDIAGQDIDHNLSSSIDDNNNKASATYSELLLGNKTSQSRSLWVGGNHRFVSQRFKGEVLSAYDRDRSWDDTVINAKSAEIQQWETFSGVSPLEGTSVQALYGQNWLDQELTTTKLGLLADLSLKKILSLNYNGTLFSHYQSALAKSHRQVVSVGSTLGIIGARVTGEELWRVDTTERGAGMVGSSLGITYAPFLLNETVGYKVFRKGKEAIIGASDTGHVFEWMQSLDRSILPSWRVSANSSWRYLNNYNYAKNTTLLLTVKNTISPQKNGFFTEQEYSTSSERASQFVQIPVYAGKGLGTHVYDSLLREYIPKTPGDFFMRQQEVYDNTSSLRIRKTSLDAMWTFTPQKTIKGILNDLSWRGTLRLDEHMDANFDIFESWCPGYFTLRDLVVNSSWKAPVQYADLSYKQDIDWSPKSFGPGLSGHAFVMPSYRAIRTYTEQSFEAGVDLVQDRSRWSLNESFGSIALTRKDSAYLNYKLRDVNLKLTQKYRTWKDLYITLDEGGGWAQKRDIDKKRLIPLDSSLYGYVTPGVSWQSFEAGFAQASYTFSYVPIPGELDYRMANGNSSGLSHVISISADVKTHNHFSINASYRTEFIKPLNATQFNPASHVLSMEVKAFL